MKSNLVTIFTPTYNRAYIISNLYNSLCQQTNKNFEWLVIDDGSSDGTKDLIDSFIKNKNDFKIRYYYKKNGGQHRALNMAIEVAEGFLVFIADSDDIISNDAVERLFDWCSTIKKGDNICGVSGPRKNMQGNIIGDSPDYISRYIDASEFERAKYHLRGDKVEAYFTSILRQYYPIESFEGEKSAEKAILWQKLALAGYKVRWFKDVIYYSEYLEDGMSAKKLKTWLNNFNGYSVYMQQYHEGEKVFFQKVKRLCTYIIVAKQKGLSKTEICERIGATNLEFLFAKIVIELYHKRIGKSKFSWMLGIENGDSFDVVKRKNK